MNELAHALRGLWFLLTAGLVAAAGFALFVLLGRYVMNGVAGATGMTNPLLTVVFVALVVPAELTLLWVTGKYVIPLATRRG